MPETAIPPDREGQIRYVLERLEALHADSAQAYALEENKQFFRSLRTVGEYLRWLYGRRRHILREELLEVNELLPELDWAFHTAMAGMERQPWPGMIRPVVDALYDALRAAPSGARVRIASLGSGSMEAERQALERVIRVRGSKPCTVVGFDIAEGARAFAQENLASLAGVRVVPVSHLTPARLAALEAETEGPLIIIADNDIFSLVREFPPHAFSFAMTVLFLHHLEEGQRQVLLKDMGAIALHTLNYDGYRTEVVLPLISMAGWKIPVFLNAAIFSSIRFPTPDEAKTLHAGVPLTFYKHGHYRALL